jgi:hypothetical protein
MGDLLMPAVYIDPQGNERLRIPRNVQLADGRTMSLPAGTTDDEWAAIPGCSIRVDPDPEPVALIPAYSKQRIAEELLDAGLAAQFDAWLAGADVGIRLLWQTATILRADNETFQRGLAEFAAAADLSDSEGTAILDRCAI